MGFHAESPASRQTAESEFEGGEVRGVLPQGQSLLQQTPQTWTQLLRWHQRFVNLN